MPAAATPRQSSRKTRQPAQERVENDSAWEWDGSGIISEGRKQYSSISKGSEVIHTGDIITIHGHYIGKVLTFYENLTDQQACASIEYLYWRDELETALKRLPSRQRPEMPAILENEVFFSNQKDTIELQNIAKATSVSVLGVHCDRIAEVPAGHLVARWRFDQDKKRFSPLIDQSHTPKKVLTDSVNTRTASGQSLTTPMTTTHQPQPPTTLSPHINLPRTPKAVRKGGVATPKTPSSYTELVATFSPHTRARPQGTKTPVKNQHKNHKSTPKASTYLEAVTEWRVTSPSVSRSPGASIATPATRTSVITLFPGGSKSKDSVGSSESPCKRQSRMDSSLVVDLVTLSDSEEEAGPVAMDTNTDKDDEEVLPTSRSLRRGRSSGSEPTEAETEPRGTDVPVTDAELSQTTNPPPHPISSRTRGRNDRKMFQGMHETPEQHQALTPSQPTPTPSQPAHTPSQPAHTPSQKQLSPKPTHTPSQPDPTLSRKPTRKPSQKPAVTSSQPTLTPSQHKDIYTFSDEDDFLPEARVPRTSKAQPKKRSPAKRRQRVTMPTRPCRKRVNQSRTSGPVNQSQIPNPGDEDSDYDAALSETEAESDDATPPKSSRLSAPTGRLSRKRPSPTSTPVSTKRHCPSSSKSVRKTPSKTPLKKATPGRRGQVTPCIPNKKKAGLKKSKDQFEVAKERLHVSAVPDSLPCREGEFTAILSFVAGKLRDRTGGCMYISGVPGTGKTATVHEITAYLRCAVSEGEIPDFNFVEVNGMRLTEPHQAYVSILKQLTGEKATADHAALLLDKYFSASKKSKSTVLLADELDLLWTRKQTILYNLFDWPSRHNARLIVLAVANTMDLPERVMKNKVSSRLGLTRLTFQPYTFQQLQEIVTSRMSGLKVFEPDAIQLAARKVAAVSGDARRALDICRRATELAQHEKGCGKGRGLIGMSQVDRAVQEMFSSAKIQAIRHSSVHEKMFLRGVLAEFRRTGLEEASFKQVNVQLQALYRTEDMRPAGHSQLAQVCSNLGACRLLLVESCRKGIHRRIRLNVSQDDVVFALRDSNS